MPEMPAELRRELFELAYTVRDKEPWEEFCDTDWYGVRDPGTGELQIVSVLGMDGKVFAVQLYRPDEGIRFWNELMETGTLNQNAVLYDMRMVECEFCEKDGLPQEDLEWNEQYPPVGKRQRKAGYVSFRSHQPGYYPWFIDEDEGRMLANAMRLLPAFGEFTDDVDIDLDVLQARKQKPGIPIFELKDGGDPRKVGDWVGRVGAFPVAPPKAAPDAPRDDVFLARMAGLKIQPGTTWEIGAFYIPGPAPMGGRLVYPLLTVTAALEAENMPMPNIDSPETSLVTILHKSFAERTEEMGHLPETLAVASDIAEGAFRELAAETGIDLLRVSDLAVVGPMFDRMIEGITGTAAQLQDAALEAPVKNEEEYREPTCPARFVMRVDLAGAKPPIWRRISLPADASFFDLHVAIQQAMGWQDCHLHRFEIRDGTRTLAEIELNNGLDDPDFGFRPEPWSELDTTLFEVVERGYRKFHYCYDFGDSWEHTIKIEEVIDPKVLNPMPELLKGRGACPPEDCGGIWGYYALLEGDPDYCDDWEPKELKKIREAEFDPDAVVFTPAREIYERWLEIRRLF